MPSEPDDKTLLEFVARFAGWTYVREYTGYGFDELAFLVSVWKRGTERTQTLPDYVGDLNVWHCEVWPKIAADHATVLGWYAKMTNDFAPALGEAGILNADARQRCLSLYRALDGKLPGETT